MITTWEIVSNLLADIYLGCHVSECEISTMLGEVVD